MTHPQPGSCETAAEKLHLEAILTQMADGMVVTDADDTIILCNPVAQRLFGVIPSEVVGKPVSNLGSGNSFLLIVEYLRELRGCAATISVLEEILAVRDLMLKLSISPLLEDEERYAGAVISVRDVTGEREMERMKREFIEAVSHELRTPLTSMRGSLQLLLDRNRELSDDDRDLLDVCRRNTERLVALTAEILEIARLSSGRERPDLRGIAVGDVTAEGLEEVAAAVESSQVTFRNLFPEDLPWIYADRVRLGKVFRNLIGNAVRASFPSGAVELDAEPDGNYLRFTITHRRGEHPGRGGSDCSERRFAEGLGTGLGMAICREIVESHHGRIDHFSGTDGSSAVSFTVPICEET